MNEKEPPRLVSVDRAAEMLGVGRRAAWRLVSEEKIRSVQIGRRRLIDVRDLHRFVELLHETGARA